jgi:hypothetical protein
MIEKKAYIGARIFDGTDEHFGAALLIEKKENSKNSVSGRCWFRV